MRRILIAQLCLVGIACGSSGGDEVDSGVRDAGVGSGDTGVAPADTGVTAADTGVTAADTGVTAADSGATGVDAGAASCGMRETERFDGVWVGRIQADVIFEPGGATPTTIMRRTEPTDFVAALFARLTPDRGVAWSAQATLGTMFDNLRFTEKAAVDPADGAVFGVVVTQAGGADFLRIYGADGMLARELTHGAARGMDLVGGQAEVENFLIKYDAAGAVRFVKRFGPDRGGRINTANVTAMSVLADRVRVVGHGAGPLVFGPGEPDELVEQLPTGGLFWADFDKADGHYLRGSARFARAAAGDMTPVGVTFTVNDDQGATPNGATVIVGSASFGGRTASRAEIGAGGSGAVTLTSTKSVTFVAVTGPAGTPAWVRTSSAIAANAVPVEPRAVAIGANGTVVLGALQPRSGGMNAVQQFSGGGGSSQRITLSADEGVLAAWGPAGEIAWVKRIRGRANFPIHRLRVDDRARAVYATGVATAGQVLGAGERTELTIAANGVFLARFNLETGALEWARSLEGADSVHDLGLGADELLLTVRATSRGVTVRGGPAAVTDTPTGTGATVVYRFSPTGDLLRCRTISTLGASAIHLTR